MSVLCMVPYRLQSLAVDVEPLIASLVGDAPWWEDLKMAMSYLMVGMDWMHNGIKSLHCKTEGEKCKTYS